MNIRANIIAGSLLLVASAPAAHAADIYAPTYGSMKDLKAGEEVIIPEAQTFTESADWFIRGDVGFSAYGGYSKKGQNGADSFGMGGYDLDPMFSGSLGFGRYVTPQVRLGLDVDYRHSQRSGYDNTGLDTGSPIANIGVNELQFTSTAVMLSAIYDFAPDHFISPYIGGGIGWAFHEGKIKGDSFVNDFDGDGFDDNGTISGVDASSDSFTAAFMTGVSFRMRRDLYLDLGYKLTYLGDADAKFDYSVLSSDTGDTVEGSGSLKIEDLLSHDVRVGLRYDLY